MKTPSCSPLPVAFLLRAPAKINWFLKITEKRNDGYHSIQSLMQCVALYDTLYFERTAVIELECDQDIPVSDNLVYKAACLLKECTEYRQGARITVKKNIPVGAGLGGGSSNAAYTLMGLNTLWGLNLAADTLRALGARIGSDVPFFFDGPCSFVEGRGEQATPVSLDQSATLLLVKPPLSVSTAWAYDAFDQKRISEGDTGALSLSFDEKLKKKPLDIKLFCQSLSKQDFATLTEMQENDLENVVIARHPVIQEMKERLQNGGAVMSAMSGSGPTVFGVFVNKNMAEQAAVTMSPNWCCIVETLI
jgi:4-diphosphocytidyl-2-C-methyl-D-erythritol kinase